MDRYVLLAVLLRILVDFLLLLTVAKQSQQECHPVRAALGAAAGGVYAAASMMSGLQFLQAPLWYGVSGVLTCLCAYGIHLMKPTLIFCLLHLAIDGVCAASHTLAKLSWGVLLCVVCIYGFGGTMGRQLVPIRLRYGGKTATLMGLYDTGNSLRDPITGRQVLVADANVARDLLGLTVGQLSSPVESICAVPGLRLISYQAVGQPSGLLLAIQIKDTRIGNRKGSVLVAFAPQVLDEDGRFQALIGGSL